MLLSCASRVVPCLTTVAVLAGCIVATPAVKIWLQSSWSAPPILLEALETAAIEDPTIYHPLLTLLSSSESVAALDHVPGHPKSEQSQLETLHDLIISSDILQSHPKFDLSSFEASLALHVAQPKLEAYFQYYRDEAQSELHGEVPDCDNWVLWEGRSYCDAGKLRRDVDLTIEGGPEDDDRIRALPRPQILSFDRILPTKRTSSRSAANTAILYLNSFTPQQSNLLEYLEEHAKRAPGFSFVVRYKPDNAREGDGERRRSSLGGYGVEMVLKRTDYLAVDDRVTGDLRDSPSNETVNQHKPSSQDDELMSVFGQDPWSELTRPLRPSEIADLGLRAASFILAADQPLHALKTLSQDFPLYSAALARKVPLTAKDEVLARGIAENQMSVRMGPGFCGIWINGRAIADNEADAFSLLDIAREERQRMLSLISLGLTPSQAYHLLTDETVGASQTDSDPTVGLVDSSDRIEGGNVILWWNDIEKDSRYADWPISVTSLFRPSRPGSFQPVRQNIWNVVLVLDLSQRVNLHVMAHTIGTLIQRGIPFRFGVVPLVGDEEDISAKMARLVHYLVNVHGRRATMDILRDLSQSGPPTATVVDLGRVEASYNHHFLDEENGIPFKDIVDGRVTSVDSGYLDRVRAWIRRVGAQRDGAALGHVFFNGRHSDFNEMWTQQIMQDYMAQLGHLVSPAIAQTARKMKRLSDFFFDLPSTAKRRNVYIVPDDGEHPLKLLDLPELQMLHLDNFAEHFIYPEADESPTPLTTRIVTDVDSDAGRQLVKSALLSLQAPNSPQRLAILHSPSSPPNTPWFSTLLYRLIASSTLDSVTPTSLLELVAEIEAKLLETDSWSGKTEVPRVIEQAVLTAPPPLHAFSGQGWYNADVEAAKVFWHGHSEALEAIGLSRGATYILMNGRLIGPVAEGAFAAEDFEALAAFELQMRAQPVVTSLQETLNSLGTADRKTLSNLMMGASALVARAYSPPKAHFLGGREVLPRRHMVDLLPSHIPAFTLGDPASSVLQVYAIIDPVSEKGQKWSSLLEVIETLDHVGLTVLLNPPMDMTEVPVKRFYRYKTIPKLDFDVEGHLSPHSTNFDTLPGEPIFTLGMDVPPSWLVSPRRSVHDLDNLRLDAISAFESVIDLTFELEQLVVEGHAREENGEPPRGLQLQLSSSKGEVLADTSVMANLGYFQFKANPGVLRFGIRPGPGTKIYSLDSVQNAATGAKVKPSDRLAVTSFQGLTILPVFKRRPGMEAADVLSLGAEETKPSLWNRLKSSVDRLLGRPSAIPATSNAEINIFTVASGLLYERFASIMILSVMRHTKSTVKFWFIENFLSPSFLEFIPLLAEEYGFQYELITYKWPSWLRAQKEKQRTIWGYKILFLDVLFPMSLDKVIFVDADQIVRTDLKELVDLDLHGRVYGYAPMGDDKKEMEGFRFWKQGYWKETLRGRPYHISALYVVDLKRFRQVAAGDRLRAQYQGLSQDPNSLSNLDQDLPNSMQDQLPIYTLDQSWLWCETWCSQESLKVAKTIDLCQNPLTKEPKLNRARAIPEWDSYDQEIASFARRVAERNKELVRVGGAMGKGVEEMAGGSPVASTKEAEAEGPGNQEPALECHVIDEL